MASTRPPAPATQRNRVDPPSVVSLARDAIRTMIVAGDLQPGERLIEERLTDELGISRPPLREAMRQLESDGLVEMRPRRGCVVTTMDEHDVFEVMTLRAGLERIAIENGVPVTEPDRLAPVRASLARMEADAEAEDRPSLVQDGYEFHASIVDLAGMRRLTSMYRSIQAQIVVCMSRNLYTRERYYESLVEHVARHRFLVELIESGEPEAVLAELAVHGERSFERPPHTP
ncbi:GntR family transcriptional regulator [Ruania alba]|uniref:DNA-binding transcriptional regulator, GntR family n=1 Tax=Ruania alba TaxID=648782 RepID=A0A1H5MEB3_9MICO|nr:GntR family transcriptional regulator [Ruania alba]SEE87646.1 DNA-binding transcriptional regulator, GntR family [Ruania alba]